MKATIILPTHTHDTTLDLSVQSALEQTVRDFELVIIGDGPTEAVREVAERLAGKDKRIRFECRPKGPRHGETYRHEALGRAKSRGIFYLADDDLWLPDHLATLLPLLRDDSLVHTYPTQITQTWMAHPYSGSPEGMLKGHNYVPFAAMAHTLATYRALPVGWSPAPENVHTDLFMWQKFLIAGFKIRASPIPTVVHFPSPNRVGWSPEARRNEVAHWAGKIAKDPRAVREALLDGGPIGA